MPPPAEDLELRLNGSITLSFRDRSHMRIKFLHGGVSRELDVGVRPKRHGSYLDHRCQDTWIDVSLKHWQELEEYS